MSSRFTKFGLILVLAGIAGFGWVALTDYMSRAEAASMLSKSERQVSEYLEDYSRFAESGEEQESYENMAALRQGHKLSEGGQGRLHKDIDALAAGEERQETDADLIYPQDWRQQVKQYRARTELNELLLSVSSVNAAAGFFLLSACFLAWTGKSGLRALGRVGPGTGRLRQRRNGKNQQRENKQNDKKNVSVAQNENSENVGRSEAGDEHAPASQTELVAPAEQKKPLEKRPSSENEADQGGLRSSVLTRRGSVATLDESEAGGGSRRLMDPERSLRRNADGSGEQDGQPAALTESSKLKNPAKKEQPQKNKKLVSSALHGDRSDSSGASATDDALRRDQAGRQEEAEARTIQKVNELARSVKLAARQDTQSLGGTLQQLARQVSAIRDYAAEQQQRVKKLQDGYDWSILKNFCLRVIRCIDNLDSRIKRLSEGGADTEHLQEVRDELLFSLESSGVEQFEVELYSDYRGQEKRLEAVKERKPCDDPSMAGKIAEVVKPGYQYIVDEDNVKIVRAAQVRLLS